MGSNLVKLYLTWMMRKGIGCTTWAFKSGPARLTQIYTHTTEITEVKLSAFAYRLFHEDFSSIYLTRLKRNLHENL